MKVSLQFGEMELQFHCPLVLVVQLQQVFLFIKISIIIIISGGRQLWQVIEWTSYPAVLMVGMVMGMVG